MDIQLARVLSLKFIELAITRRAKHGRKHVRPSTIVEYADILQMPESELITFFEVTPRKPELALDVMIAQADPGKRKLLEDPSFVSTITSELQITEDQLRTYVDFLGEERQRRFHLA